MIRLLTLPLFTLLLAFAIAGFADYELAITDVAEISYPEHLTGVFTGGFGEETCRSCHFDYDLNPDSGKLTVSGIPKNLSAGETVEIQISVEREELGAAGFQLSTRYADGRQAGIFDIKESDRIMFSEATPDSFQYVQHSKEGIKPSEKNKTSWTVNWQAPDSSKGPILFNIAANAANGDMSEFGDFIYSKEVKSRF